MPATTAVGNGDAAAPGPTGTVPALEVVGVGKSYGSRPALRSVDLRIDPGEILALLGPNGAGKSTLVTIVAGLRRPDTGSVRITGLDVAARPRTAQARVGLAPQDLAIYPRLTVRENLEFFATLAGLRGRQLTRRCAEAADGLDLDALLDRRGAHLSGGEKRRLHTAVAVVHRPPLLLLDEPTAGVDTQTRIRLLEFVRGLAADGAAVCYTTHYLAEVEALGSAVAILQDGRIRHRSSQEALIAAHARPVVEVVFAGPAPRPVLPGVEVTADESTLRLRPGADAPTDTGVVVAALMRALGDDVARVRDLTVRQASLETAYLALTGLHPGADGAVDGAATSGEAA